MLNANVSNGLLFVRIAVIAVVMASNHAWAINKCTGTDGKVVYQDAPCAGRGEAIDVRPSRGHTSATQSTAVTAPTATQNATAPTKKEGAFGASWQRRTYLENRGIADARAAIDGHQRSCAAKQAELVRRKGYANNNLAGATWEQSISAEMQAAATMCDSRARELRAELESLQKELRELQAQQ